MQDRGGRAMFLSPGGAPSTTTYSPSLCCHLCGLPQRNAYRLMHGRTGIEGWIPTRRFQPWTALVPTPIQSVYRPVPPPEVMVPHGQTSPPPPTPLTSTPAEQEVQLRTALHSATLPPELPIKETIGKSSGLMRPQPPYCNHHPAIPLLRSKGGALLHHPPI